jgi:hypothetical protein
MNYLNDTSLLMLAANELLAKVMVISIIMSGLLCMAGIVAALLGISHLINTALKACRQEHQANHAIVFQTLRNGLVLIMSLVIVSFLAAYILLFNNPCLKFLVEQLVIKQVPGT